jgi:hypothetical protein
VRVEENTLTQLGVVYRKIQEWEKEWSRTFTSLLRGMKEFGRMG